MRKPFQTRIEYQNELERRALKITVCCLATAFAVWSFAALVLPRGHVDTIAVFNETTLGSDVDQVRDRLGAPERMDKWTHWGCGQGPYDRLYLYWDKKHRDRKIELSFCAYDGLYLAEVHDGQNGVILQLYFDEDRKPVYESGTMLGSQ